ncbi:unnamed protein product [Hermetia illucens]|uniref:lysozyme n=1 Tax=Hermetia illucens TaxID=343691 RepID=A0A7R8UJC3_HERIL|nr:uncharacterized protein LOC119648161 isoform X1 [Hermetia illucens]CAD7081920.1 unnamed protein product [Hermetia illucens]
MGSLTKTLCKLLTLGILCHVAVAKVFERCELAKLLKDKHRLSIDEVANWVCIAQHQSNFNSGLRTGAPDNGAHGLFQISDQFWCSPPGKGDACGVSCDRLRDDDLTDDIDCVRRIYDEHQRISGDGYTAWTMYTRFCKGRAKKAIEGCFESPYPKRALDRFESSLNTLSIVYNKAKSKVYTRCELAKELRYKHNVPTEQIATWVCIAKHESNFNTSAIGRLNTDGSGDHGLFQVSDIYWCSPPGQGWACGLSCSDLEDSDITDDVECIKKIYEEHTRISGDGFNAWVTYQPHCKGRADNYIQGCFTDIDSTTSEPVHQVGFPQKPHKRPLSKPSKPGKVYTPCELATELRHKHKIPLEQIATWVCIAKHESNFNTSAIGRLNTDGSEDHGIFQVSDIYWCSPPGNGWACGLSCGDLEDSDITDDVECIRKIYEEHTRLSGDGFNAWTVYKPHCKEKADRYIQGCFSDTATNYVTEQPQQRPSQSQVVSKPKGKVYTPCELAKELRYTHKIPKEQIPTWICIAKHESNFNTSAIGRLNGGGSEDHGLFQISDIYWCSPPGKGWVCGLSCSELEDSDITDDVECMKKIYEEHQRLSGDGFNAWAVYKPYCQGRSEDYIRGCFADYEGGSESLSPVIPDRGSHRSPSRPSRGRGKIYTPCELAKELRYKHHIPLEQIDTWVCIAKHESNFNTSAIGRLNGDGSEDHGLFQISDIYWCSPPGKGWACGLSCSDLEDSDISDDVECIKKIYEEHTRLSGDGFNAWAVYNPHCKGHSRSYTQGCFDDYLTETVTNALIPVVEPKQVLRGPSKIYTRCELADELRFKHKLPEDQIATWVCIAEHESRLNTGAMNAGSGDHGLFQISELFWCDTSGPGKECRVECSKFRDGDITDDVACIKKIYKEHSRLSGDGFNAWVVYPQHCKGRADSYVKGCSQVPPQTIKPTKRPQIPIPAITAPSNLPDYREQFLKQKFTTKVPLYSATRKPPAFGSRQDNVVVTPTSQTFDDVFFSSRFPFERIRPTTHPKISRPTVSTIRPQPTFPPGQPGTTAGSRFSLPSATPAPGRLSTTRKQFISPTEAPKTSIYNAFDSFTRPIIITPTTKQPAKVTTSNRFAAFDATSRFSTTKAYSKPTPTTIASKITTAYPRQHTRPSPTYFGRTRPTPTLRPEIFIPSQVPKTYDNVFDFYFDLYKLQRQPINIPTPRFQASSALIYQGTTKSPFVAQDIQTSKVRDSLALRNPPASTVQPFVSSDFSATPEFRGYRFGTAYDNKPSQLFGGAAVPRKPLPSENIEITRRPAYRFGQFSPISANNVTRNYQTTRLPTYREFTTVAPVLDSTSQFRGFRFGLAYTSQAQTLPESSTRRPFWVEDATVFSTRRPFEVEDAAAFTSRKPFQFEDNQHFTNRIHPTEAPIKFSATNAPFSFDNFNGPDLNRDSVTRRPFPRGNFAISESRTLSSNEDLTTLSSQTGKPFGFRSRFYPDDDSVAEFQSTTLSPRNAFDELFDRFVH